MKITDIRIREVSIPRIYETYAADPKNLQAGTDHSRSVYQILECVTDEGQVGLGEFSDLDKRMQPLGPSEMRNLLLDSLEGVDIADWRSAYERASAALPTSFHPELRGLVLFGVEIALLDLVGKKYSVPLYELLGGKCRDRVPVSWVAYLRGAIPLETELEAIGAEIREKVEEGFRAFKLKVGEDHERDLARIRILREIAGKEVFLKVDVSGAWDRSEAIPKLRDMADAGVDACETPISEVNRAVANDRPELINKNADSIARKLASIREASPLKIIEHVADLDDGFLTALIRHRSVDIVNIIPSQGRGLRRAKRLAHAAEVAGIPALLGSTIELGLGTAAFVHLAIATQNISVASDLVGPGLLVDDVCRTPFRFHDGALRPFQGPGLGMELDETKMEKWKA